MYQEFYVALIDEIDSMGMEIAAKCRREAAKLVNVVYIAATHFLGWKIYQTMGPLSQFSENIYQERKKYIIVKI
jgi:hypothetical protein